MRTGSRDSTACNRWNCPRRCAIRLARESRRCDTTETSPRRLRLGVDAEFRPARKAHPALVLEGLELLVDRLRAAGVTVRDDEPLAAHARAYVDDPFGNRIELLEPLRRTA